MNVENEITRLKRIVYFLQRKLAEGGGGGGSTTFIGLTDTPSSYVSQEGKIPAVNSGQTALEFISTIDGGNA